MALKHLEKIAMWLLPIVGVAAVVALSWLKQQNPAAAGVVAPVLVIFLMAYGVFLTYRQQRRLDEVQIASQRFAHTHGGLVATLVTVLLLTLPPVTNWLIDLANLSSTGSPDVFDRGAVRKAFIYGASLMVVMQTLGGLVAAALWWRRMGGMGERS